MPDSRLGRSGAQRWTLYFCRDCAWKGIDDAAHSCVFNAEDRRIGTLPNGVKVLGVEAVRVIRDPVGADPRSG